MTPDDAKSLAFRFEGMLEGIYEKGEDISPSNHTTLKSAIVKAIVKATKTSILLS